MALQVPLLNSQGSAGALLYVQAFDRLKDGGTGVSLEEDSSLGVPWKAPTSGKSDISDSIRHRPSFPSTTYATRSSSLSVSLFSPSALSVCVLPSLIDCGRQIHTVAKQGCLKPDPMVNFGGTVFVVKSHLQFG